LQAKKRSTKYLLSDNIPIHIPMMIGNKKTTGRLNHPPN